MRNFIKYPPFEWRKGHEFCTPAGPYFAGSPVTPLYLGGNRVCITAPRHSPRRSIVRQTSTCPGYDVVNDSPAGLHTDFSMPGRRWGVACLWARRWAFYGPWMSGCKGELHTSIAIIGRSNDHQLPNLSFLNPKAFEAVLLQYLNDRYGHENWEGDMAHIPRYHGPVEWRCYDHLPVPSASFKIYNRGEDLRDLVLPDHLFVFPVTEKYFIEVCFIQDLYSRDEKGNVAFDTRPLQELQEKIFNSITLELGPDTRAKVDEVKAKVGTLQLCKTFAPLKWPTNIYPPEPSHASEMQKSLKAGC